MPFTGGFSPSPERTGGGDGAQNAPLLQRVFEGIAARRGPALTADEASIVGAENMAFARAITFDLYGANERFANEMNPATATVGGYLPRWEKILAQPPLPGDTEADRQARCAAALARFGKTNNTQAVYDACAGLLGPIFVGLTLQGPNGAAAWWPGFGGAAAKITGVSGNLVTIVGLANVPSAAGGNNITLSNATNAGNDGTYAVHSWVSSSSVVFVNNGSPVSPDNGVGGSSGSPTIVWSMPNLASPFTSTVAHIDVQVNPFALPGYANSDGSVNAKFFATVNAINPVLDWMLPADCTFDWYFQGSNGAGFFLDDPNNLDCEIFDS